jgi:type 1 glutamine amidotransferase/nicotinamidase-related amidase
MNHVKRNCTNTTENTARYHSILPALLCMLLIATAILASSATADAQDTFKWTVRSRAKTPASAKTNPSSSDNWQIKTKTVQWQAKETAVVICDMWNYHHSRNATLRVGEMAPRMNQVVKTMRKRGAFIIHAPSSCMKFYANHPARQRAQKAPKAANLPTTIRNWCNQIDGEQMKLYPIDQSDGGDDDHPARHQEWATHLKAIGHHPGHPWTRQISTIEIDNAKDIVSDQGDEIWNAMEQRGIKHVVLVGVHTNMCVLGRPFGLRQMSQNGKDVVLMRDMTDTMYNPKRKPFVAHYRGTDLIVEHIEKYVAPSVTSDQLLGGKTFVFKWDVPTKVTIAIAEREYKTKETLPALAKQIWTKQRGYQVTVLQGDANKHTIPGLAESLKTADVLVLSIRRQALPADQLKAIRAHLDAGKPVLAIRTSSHAFDARGKGPKGHAQWPTFDPDVLGGNYQGHYGNQSYPTISSYTQAAKHPILQGVKLPITSGGSLYKANPLAKTTTALLMGNIKDRPAEPVAWTNTFGKAKVFYTSLGHVNDFKQASFVKLMTNAMDWARTLPSDLPQ